MKHWQSKIGKGLYWALQNSLGAIHAGTAWLLVRTGRCVGRVLSFVPWPCKLALLSVLLAALALCFGLYAGPPITLHGWRDVELASLRPAVDTWLVETLDLAPAHLDFLRQQGWVVWFNVFCLLGLGVAAILGVATLLAFVPMRLSFLVLRIGGAGFAAWWFGLLLFIVRIPGALFALSDRAFDKGMRNELWINGVVVWLGPALVAAAYLLCLFLRSAKRFYGRRAAAPALIGDRIVENLRTHGGDPVFRTSLYWAVFLHVFFIFLLPYALTHGFGSRAYGIPLGSGVPSVGGDAVVKLISLKAPKKRISRVRYVLSLNTPIYYHVPDLDESDALHAVEAETQLTYVADRNAVFGKPGAGSGGRGGKLGAGGGTRGGWPEGTAKARIRFIRLEYGGPDWDDGMDAKARADINFLEEFERLTGLKTATRSESLPIRLLLRRYDKGYAPPFVYMTGSGAINIPGADLKILREYLLDGGMLFADCGSPQWDAEFRRFILALFPDKRLCDIPDDDPIFQMPYVFPNGAPPLWHHGGSRVVGIKHQDRWIVFYHPGDINDAWKTGHSGIRPELAKAAYQLGVNVVYYAFTHYLEQTRKYRK